MGLTFRGADKEIVIFKAGNTYDKYNFYQFTQSITRVEIKIQVNRSGTFQIECQPSLSDGLKILQSGALTVMTDYASKLGVAEIFKEDASTSPSLADLEASVAGAAKVESVESSNLPVVALKLMWPGDMLNSGNPAETPWFVGAAYSPDVSFDSKTFSFTLKGTAFLDRIAGIYGTKVFKNQSITDIIKGVDSSLEIVALDDETKEKINDTKISFVYNDSARAAIERLLYQTNIVFFSKDKKLYLRKRESIYRSRPAYQFVAFRQIDPSKNIYPIIEYSTEGLGRLLTGGLALGALAKSFDMSKKEVVSKAISESLNPDVKTAVEKQEASPDEGAPLLSHAYLEETQGANFHEQAKAIHQIGRDSYFQVTITTLGIPEIMPSTMVDVRIGDDSTGNGLPGVSGKGMVQTVTHQFDNGSWRTILEVRIGASIGNAEYADIPEFDPDAISEADVVAKAVQNI